MKYAVITGASKGLGFGLAKQFLNKEISVVSVSRTENTELKELAEVCNVGYLHYNCDLSSEDDRQETFEQISAYLKNKTVDQLFVVNNAGIVDPIETVGKLQQDIVKKHFSLNVLAPIFITNLFVRKDNLIPTVIINISSGAGSKAVHGWSTYCSSKAALNMFTETTALELNNVKSIHKVIAYSPSIMDTDMQGEIRSASKEAFDDIDKFKDYKEKGLLRDPNVVATAFVNMLVKEELENGKIYHVSELLD
ncbi:benzil reductase ((S)-benzoin forming) [Salirhabdus euzebyi]|uniref:Benzil reductase ((S)-benzoin forming) n=1 Tax=Salirhabdus euzebyi TaxID=394506 RepID=A0A841Q1B1_9BACI|nr:(S)-benzoin forming benzil reductase [Salirhabdus euzebyi]MBB6451903.1 benzil reductase ((S)-benzoin forming) [Salirhabdus euzebyi]